MTSKDYNVTIKAVFRTEELRKKEADKVGMLIGQIVGIAAVVLGFVSFQMRTQKQLLLVQTAATVAFCIHYWLIGAASGMMLNLIGIARNIAYYHKEKPLFYRCPVFFAVVMGLVGLLSWQGYYSVFIVLGLVINTLCLSLNDPQKIRGSILVTSPMVLLYNVFVLSAGGIIYESVAIASAVIGLIRYRRQNS